MLGIMRRAGPSTGSVTWNNTRLICPKGPLGFIGNQLKMMRTKMTNVYRLMRLDSTVIADYSRGSRTPLGVRRNTLLVTRSIEPVSP